MFSKIVFAICLSIISILASAQELETGIPQVKNFGPADYRQESQNFSVVQDKNSLMFFGNVNGIMEFDNEKWTLTKVAGRPKLAVSDQNEVYFGGYNVVGRVHYSKGEIAVEEFTNIADKTFGQIRKVVTHGDKVYFATNNKLFLYSAGNFKTIVENQEFTLFDLGEKVYLQKNDEGLMCVKNDKLVKDSFCRAVDSVKIVNMVKVNNNIILHNSKNFYVYNSQGLTMFPTQADQYINENEITCLKNLRDGNLIVGTRHGGVISINGEGAFRYLINTANGLRNNTINDLFVDNQGKVWVATENGISLLETNSDLSFFYSANGLAGSVISFIRYKNRLYVGTTVGLYCYRTLESNVGLTRRFLVVNGIKDHCWQLFEYDDELYAVAQEGLFCVNGDQVELVLEGSFQTIKMLEINGRKEILLGGFDGLSWIKITDGKVKRKGLLKNMPYRVRTISADSNGNVWMGTDSDGLFMVNFGDSIDLNAKVRSFNGVNGFPNDYEWVDVVPTKRFGTIFSTSVGVFVRDEDGKFLKDKSCFDERSATPPVYSPIAEDKYRNIWYSRSFDDVYEREVGIITYDSLNNEKRYTAPFGQMKESVVETIFPEDEVVWFGTSDALMRYERRLNDSIQKENAFVCMVRNVLVANDSLIYTFDQDYTNDTKYKVRFLDKKIRFDVAGLAYNTFGETEYQYKLVGFDDEWSDWTTESYKEYTSLHEDKYIFQVRSRNGYGQLSNIDEFAFEVTPPYYRTIFAYILYLLVIVVIVLVIIAWRSIVHSKEKYNLERLVEKRTMELSAQKEQTENLVKKLLPQNAVDVITGKTNKTEKFEMVTVLFSDIQGFTKIAASTNPDELIKYLNELFVAFDNIISKYNIEKIKTIGDAYMCAGGMPNRDRVNPVEVVLAGLEMQRALIELNKTHELQMQIRIGVHTGPVVAGVVGAQKLEYDIWGDTVNIASRMESHGEVGKVNVSEETYRHVKEFFVCQNRGIMEVKGKGEMEMYFVESIPETLSENADGITPNHLFNVRMLNMNYSVMQDEILEKMQRDLPKNLYYHNLKHTTDTIYRVTDIGIKENVSEEELLLLRCAALFHDSGFMVSYENNETIGANLALQIMAKYKYSREQIEVVRGIIMATKVPQNPHNLLEEIMCDADLDYLGRPDFIPISQNLFRELFERGKIDSMEQWNKMQFNFITNHHYFTETAKRNGDPGKQAVLKELKELI